MIGLAFGTFDFISGDSGAFTSEVSSGFFF